MMSNTSFSWRNPMIWLMCLVMVGVAGCVAVKPPTTKKKHVQTIWPEPPDPPRFAFDWVIFGSASVEPVTEDQKLQEALLGRSGRRNEPFGKPYAITVNKGRIFVSDSVSRAVRVFDAPSGTYFVIGAPNEENHAARLMKPLGIDTDAQGTLYVMDATLKQVKVYSRDGEYLRTLLKPGDIDRPSSVTVDPDGERIYVVDIGGPQSENHRVRVYNATTGEHLFDIGKRGSGPGEFNLPRDVAIAPNGDLYVSDGGNFRIEVFDHNGKFLRTFGEIGKQLGNFGRPKELAIDKDGNVYVIDAAFGNFQIFNSEGQLLMFIGERSNINGPGKYMLPSGIAVDEDGRVYAVDQWFKKVDIFRPIGLPYGTGYTVFKARQKK
jgi:DNA-binding beta-propeller fold protein YncE